MAAHTISPRLGAALLLLCGLHAVPGHAQTAAAGAPKSPAAKPDAADDDEPQEEIVVSGHRLRGAASTDVPPEVSINATAVRALGAADLDEVFQDLAPEIGTGVSETTASGGPIVLVNGQRIAGFSSVKDLPPEAVQRIEIFPDKVALQYGYGAGQRVVNIVLRSRYRALTLLGRYTLAPDDWRGIYRAKVDLLRIGETSHWNIDLDYRHEDPIFAGTTLVGPPGAIDDGGKVPAHTLARQDDHLTISGAGTRLFGDVSAELTASLDLDALQSLPGLSDQDGDLLAQEGLAALATGPLYRLDRTAEAQTNLTLNGKLDTWRWSFIGRLDETTRLTRTEDAAGTGGTDTILLPSPGLLREHCTSRGDVDCVATTTRTASGDLYLNGNLFSLPAGDVTAALRTGFVVAGLQSDSSSSGLAKRARDEGNAQANLDFPLTPAASVIGKLSVGVNGELRRLSDFGTLSTIGSTFEWSPVKPVTILASFSREQQAPSLVQLGEATLDTPDLREYDFATGATTIIQRIEGGNGDLARETARIGHLRLQVNPLRATDLTFSADYTIDHSRDPIASLTAATSAIAAAFPDQSARENGYLTVLDTNPVNLARRDTQQIRLGLTYSTAFGAVRQPPAGSTKLPARDQFQIALYDTWHLEDRVVLRDGLPALNLLGDDIISDQGGTPTHALELQTTVSTGAWSADVNAVWHTPTSAAAGTLDQERLSFSQGVTLNMRLQLNLTDQRWLTHLLPFLRGNLNISADNLLGAHTRVHDSSGTVPAAYSESYLNPTGRTFRITLRKRFR